MRRGKILRSWWSDYSWIIILVLGVTSLVLGYIGFWKHGQTLDEQRSILDTLYLTLGLISMNTGAVSPPVNWQLQVARFMIPAVTAYTAFLAFTTLFIQQTDRVRLWFIRDHVIICGLGQKGFRLANQFLQSGVSVVVIEANERNEWIENVRSAGGVVINGDAGDPELLAKVKLNQAQCLIAVVGDDGKNAEIAVLAEEISQSRTSGTLTCTIHIFDAQLWRLLREKELQAHHNSHFRLELFNIFERGAHLMVQDNPPWARVSPGQAPRVLVVGLGKMGQQVIIEAARGWQFINPDQASPINFSVIDRDAKNKLTDLFSQHPRLEKLGHFNPINMDISSGEFDKIGERFLEGSTYQLDIAYICLDDETFCLQSGLRLNHQLRKYRIPIVLRMVENGGLALLVGNRANEQDSLGNLMVFDLLDQTCTAELLQKGTHEVLARNLHAVYLEGVKRSGQETPEDGALVPWEDLSDYLKDKNRQLADRIPATLADTGYRIAPLTDWDAECFLFQEGNTGEDDEVTRMARMEHENWCQGKQKEGWKYGPEKDPENKTNPSLQSWDELPAGEKEKNKEFIRGLPLLLARAGFQIERQ
jgi:hypothetical protein